jgi:hypothetical protein
MEKIRRVTLAAAQRRSEEKKILIGFDAALVLAMPLWPL